MSNESSLKMIVGLGNPGPKYNKNRHNVGFQCIELYAKRHQITGSKMEMKAMTATGWVEKRRYMGQEIQRIRHKLLLVKPLTYMNNSGQAVGQLARYYKVELEDIMVIYDDLDLPTGKLRLRQKGSAGGQNGVKSLITHLGTQEFARVRVGIDRPLGQMPAAAYVLQDFSKAEEEEMAITREQVCDALDCWLFEDMTTAMNRFN